LLKAGPQLDMPAAIDIEQPRSPTDTNLPNMAAAQIIAWLETFIQVFVDRMGYFPFFYTYPSYAKMLGKALSGSALIGKCPLWIADGFHGMWPADGTVTVICNPKSVWFTGGPWNDFAMMQTVGNAAVGTVPPVQTIVDTDVFNGTADDLRALTQTGGALASVLPGVGGAIVSGRAGFFATLLAGVAAGIWWLFKRRAAR
jgi:GH25 family lysozyme M1 (1,4-beta-N-acetylmuramidase)